MRQSRGVRSRPSERVLLGGLVWLARRLGLACWREKSIHILGNGVTLQTICPLVSSAAIARQDLASAVHMPPHGIGPVVRAGDLQSFRHKYRQPPGSARAGEGAMVGSQLVYCDD